MSVITNLKVVAAKHPEQQPAIVRRRNKLISQLHDQLELDKQNLRDVNI